MAVSTVLSVGLKHYNPDNFVGGWSLARFRFSAAAFFTVLAWRTKFCDICCIQQQLPVTEKDVSFLQGPKCFIPAPAASFALALFLS